MDNLGVRDVQVGFDEPVTFPIDAVTAWTRSAASGPVIESLQLDPATNVWTIRFTEPIREDRLTVVIDYTVTDLAGNELDSEIFNPANASLPSGHGIRGGQAVFRMNILQGDANQDGTVDAGDAKVILDALGTCMGDSKFGTEQT